ncbi:CO or xanthine dehydrogenase, FAD-binding subunit [Bacillus sp. OV322]|uniref:FAD binding domain-containing protein n=1 Tax=Bacillus sp. OV322 TaxID=1882764 RepID=UPI0008DF7BF1|nr:FAD binding domain-containing protein [Bacillus sp. OV322]SFC67952.1 CO or xanthine dehydrogenase, FAD-binding subunit [Bacillus sp. OV322]
MISYDREYYKPKTIQEAAELYYTLDSKGKAPIFFNGGTEIITLGRLNLISANAFIDIKDIPECKVYEMAEGHLVIGSSLPLSRFDEKQDFPLLSQLAKGVADATSRNKITIGGNMCGNIFYREAILPFLLADSMVYLASRDGMKKRPILEVFHKEMLLEKGEFLVQISTPAKYLNMPYASVKRRQQWDTGYPLLTVASIKKGDMLRFAFSGLCSFPFRSHEMEKVLNDSNKSYRDRILSSFSELPAPVLNDIEGSSDYRLFVLKNILLDFFALLEGDV